MANGSIVRVVLAACLAVLLVAVGVQAVCPLIAKGIPCPKKDHGVQCFADPCRVIKCPNHPRAVCLASYCSKPVLYDGQLIGGPCAAVYVDPRTCKVVKCDAAPAS